MRGIARSLQHNLGLAILRLAANSGPLLSVEVSDGTLIPSLAVVEKLPSKSSPLRRVRPYRRSHLHRAFLEPTDRAAALPPFLFVRRILLDVVPLRFLALGDASMPRTSTEMSPTVLIFSPDAMLRRCAISCVNDILCFIFGWCQVRPR